MRRYFTKSMIAAAALVWGGSIAQAQDVERIVSLGGSVTEILYELGADDRIAALDVTSVYPPQALKDKPNVGYIRALNAEGVLAADPDLIIAEHDAGPPEVVDILAAASVPFVKIDAAYSAEGILKKIRTIGAAIGEVDAAEVLAGRVAGEFATTEQAVAAASDGQKPKVLFILSLQDGRLMVAGANNQADSVIAMAGGENLMQSFEGFKSVDDEALLANPPDVIVMMMRANHGADNSVLSTHPALKDSPAIRDQRIVRMGGMYLLGFGPRTAYAVADLARALYPDAAELKALPKLDDKP